jgi:hypothetical protein
MSGDKLAQKNDTAFMRRFFFLATGMMWSVMAIAGYRDHGRWYSHNSGFDTLIIGIIVIVLVIVIVSALVQKLQNDENWRAGGCLFLVIIAIFAFVAFMSSQEKSRHKEKQLYHATQPSNYQKVDHGLHNVGNTKSDSDEPVPITSDLTISSSTVSPSQQRVRSTCVRCRGRGVVHGLKEVEVMDECPQCNGYDKCSFCSGSGYITIDNKAYSCSLCDGAGKVPSNCFLCSSTGKIKIIKTIETTETCLFCNGTGYTDK